MKTNINQKTSGFTLIEMVGVLAIIAVLAAILIPKIFAAINESRLNNAVVSANTAKTAALGYFGKYSKFGTLAGADMTTNMLTWDRTVLIPEGYLEKPFETRVATTNRVQMVAASTATTAASASNSAYNLDNNTTVANDAAGRWVIQAHLGQVSIEDAIEINNRIDGDLDKVARGSTAENLLGRVKYATPSSGLTEVYIYLAHK